jgi:hypothetical protein
MRFGYYNTEMYYAFYASFHILSAKTGVFQRSSSSILCHVSYVLIVTVFCLPIKSGLTGHMNEFV